MQSTHTFVGYVEDRPGVLNRVASLFRRRNFNIESLTVGKSHQPGVSRMTVVACADEHTARLIEANLYKLINVLRVENVSSKPAVQREMALIKVAAGRETRGEIIEIADIFGADVIDASPRSLIVELTGEIEKVERMIVMLDPFGIIELQRTGLVAMSRGEASLSADPPQVHAIAREAV